EAELDCRKRQYEYYRNKLLTFSEIGGGTEIVWKTLGEVSKKISSGGTPKTTVSEYYNGEIPWLRTQEVGYGEIWDTSIKITEEAIKNSSAKWIPKDCVIIAMYGATVGRVGINKIPLTTNQACANIEVNEEIANYKYIYYYLLNQYEYIKSLGAGSQTNINAQIVKSLKIPLPPLEEQQRIANILDKFDTLVNSISEGLPKEIALRRKQYEYYREQLLSFPS
ncbi:MAG: restriction endonuclease subunit S, partial [Capnocytophaga ochracea]